MKLNKSCHIYGLFQRTMKIRGALICILLFFVQMVQAQQEAPPDFMRSVGKIYVVAAVTLIILLTLLVYMVFIDRKISRLEKQHKNE